MSKAATQWDRAQKSYENYRAYLSRKSPRSNPTQLTVIDLLYVRNFKGGNASIHELEAQVDEELRPLANLLETILSEFRGSDLKSLDSKELKALGARATEFLESADQVAIHGFGPSAASAVLHFHAPRLLPILDRRVLNGAGIKVKRTKAGQVVRIKQYYVPLLRRFHSTLRRRRTALSIRELDREWFIKPIK